MPEKVGLAALEATASSINTVVTEEKSFIETLSNNCSVMEDHFTLISAKEQISHAVLLSGDVFYNQRMDSLDFLPSIKPFFPLFRSLFFIRP